tara:strand:+ start:909 stop:1253 length:345 start_codon:yes stop_codon:yes gene_type:complete
MINAKIINKEKYYGNKEYKLKLIKIVNNKIDKLITQFKFRLFEGRGCAWYYLGYNDDGIPLGLSNIQFSETITNILEVINYLKLDIIHCLICKGIDGYCCILKLKSRIKIDLIY